MATTCDCTYSGEYKHTYMARAATWPRVERDRCDLSLSEIQSRFLSPEVSAVFYTDMHFYGAGSEGKPGGYKHPGHGFVKTGNEAVAAALFGGTGARTVFRDAVFVWKPYRFAKTGSGRKKINRRETNRKGVGDGTDLNCGCYYENWLDYALGNKTSGLTSAAVDLAAVHTKRLWATI
jgi:hypothetical protein